jgi:hypothetical protein
LTNPTPIAAWKKIQPNDATAKSNKVDEVDACIAGRGGGAYARACRGGLFVGGGAKLALLQLHRRA